MDTNEPLWQLTGEEYVQLHAHACTLITTGSKTTRTITRVIGVRALAENLACSESAIYALKREGVLDAAVVSNIGKNTVFDAEKARELAQAYKLEKRKSNNNNKK